MDHDLAKAANMKLILSVFEQLSSLKINFHKSELYSFEKAKEHELTRSFLAVVWAHSPLSTLAFPSINHKLRNQYWKAIADRPEKCLSSWQSKNLSYGVRLVLINSMLSSLPIFMMSLLEIPKGVRKRLDFYQPHFFWQLDKHKRKYRLARWGILCTQKDQSDLSIQDLETKNTCFRVNDSISC